MVANQIHPHFPKGAGAKVIQKTHDPLLIHVGLFYFNIDVIHEDRTILFLRTREVDRSREWLQKDRLLVPQHSTLGGQPVT